MDLLEYQAKQLFTTIGIPVLSSQSISQPSELKNLQIPYPIVLKSQVKANSRGKAGGVRFVENTIDAIAAAQTIFTLPIKDEYPEVILAEARYDAENEFFLAVMFDKKLKKPVLLGSSHGGMDVENVLKNMQTCVVKDDFSPFYARRLAVKMGLKGNLIESVSHIIEKMYALFWENDLEIIEINPLAINSDDQVMALDGKIRVNDHALTRHPDLLALIGNHPEDNLDQETTLTTFSSQSLINLNPKGNIAIISNSEELNLLTHNLIIGKKGKIQSSFLLQPENQLSLKKQLNSIFEHIFSSNNLKFILINILGSDHLNQEIVDAIADFYEQELNNQVNKGQERMERLTGSRSRPRRTRKSQTSIKKISATKQIQWVLRMVSNNPEQTFTKLAELPVKNTDDLEEAINLIV